MVLMEHLDNRGLHEGHQLRSGKPAAKETYNEGNDGIDEPAA